MTESKPPEGNGTATGKKDYPVGYGKPPVEHQFPPNTSGNPGGRPTDEQRAAKAAKMSAGLTDAHKLWLEEAATPMKITLNGELETVSAMKAVILSVRNKALGGGITAQRTYLAMCAEAQKANRQLETENFEGMAEYKFMAEAEIMKRKRNGRPYDDILPHPDDVIIDARLGFCKIVGPIDEGEREAYSSNLAALAMLQESISDLASRFKKAKAQEKTNLLETWHTLQAAYDRANDHLPPSMQVKLEDRSTAPGASKEGDFFQHTAEQIMKMCKPSTKRNATRRRA